MENTLVWLIEALVIVFAVFAVNAAARAFGVGPRGRTGLAIAAGAALFWAAAWKLVPLLAALRVETRWGLPVSVLTVIIGFAVARAVAGLQVVERRPLLQLAPWRAVFGGLLIAVGLSGGLPASFFWSAGLGDIAVGLFGVALLARGGEPGDGVWAALNIAGLADLLHVLALAAIFLQPFLLARPELSPASLLPAAGVPMFIAIHFSALVSLRRGRPKTRHA